MNISHIQIGATNIIKAFLGNTAIYQRAIGLAHLFSDGQQGVWLDPSDLTTLFQDANGNIPVATTGDPVGLMLDKSQGLILSAEKIINGTFNVDTSNWIVSGGSIQAVVEGRVLITAGSVFGSYQEIPTVVGRVYTVSLDMQLVTSGSSISCRVSPSGGFATIAESTVYVDTANHQEVSFRFNATSTSMRIYLRVSGSGNSGYFDNVTVKELQGNHAVQFFSASRLTYRTDGFLHWLRQDGVDDYMKSSDFGLTQPVSMAFAMSTTKATVFFIDGLSANSGSIVANNRALRLYSGSGDAGYYSPLITYDVNHIYDVRLSGNTSYITFDNNPITIRPTGTAGMGGITIGASGSTSGFNDGRFYGMVVVAGDLSTTDRQSVKTYLATKSGVIL